MCLCVCSRACSLVCLAVRRRQLAAAASTSAAHSVRSRVVFFECMLCRCRSSLTTLGSLVTLRLWVVCRLRCRASTHAARRRAFGCSRRRRARDRDRARARVSVLARPSLRLSPSSLASPRRQRTRWRRGCPRRSPSSPRLPCSWTSWTLRPKSLKLAFEPPQPLLLFLTGHANDMQSQNGKEKKAFLKIKL